MVATYEDEYVGYDDEFLANPTSTQSVAANGNNASGALTVGAGKSAADNGVGTAAAAGAAAPEKKPASRFQCEARTPVTPAAGVQQQLKQQQQPHQPLFAFELEVHGAAEWGGAAAAGAAVQVWARLEEGGDRGAFQRLWEALQQDVLRQNRRWRREMLRAGGGGGWRREGGTSGGSGGGRA